jgi:membrane protein
MTDDSVIENQQIPANKLKAGWELLKLTLTEWTNDNAFELSAALAFYTIFSIAPVLLIAVGVASFFLAPDTATDQIVGEMEKMIGAQGANAVRQVIESSRGFGKGLWAVSIGIVTLIMGATAVFGELQSALNQIWDVKAKPDRGVIMSFIVDRLRGIPWVWQTANVVASFFVIAVLFAAIYKFLPDVLISWKDVSIGAAVTALLFTGGKYAIGIYLGKTATASAFGAAGSLVVLLFWVYYSALISFLGAEFTQVYARRYGPGIRPQKHAVRVGRKSDSI